MRFPRFLAPGPSILLLFALVAAAALLAANPAAAQPANAPDPSAVKASAFAGMVEVPAGKFKMGIEEKYFKRTFMKTPRTTNPQLLGRNKEIWWPILMWETSEHKAETEAYAIDAFEVTNAQYLQFLNSCCRTSSFTTKQQNSIYKLATEMYGQNPTEWQMKSIYLLNRKKFDAIEEQVLGMNRDLANNVLKQFNAGMPAAGRVKSFADLPDKLRIETWVKFDLPEKTALTSYSRTIPRHWVEGGAQPTKKQLAGPVRYVTGYDADAFAEWAGKHVPTEEEWEKAARGPKGSLYPWGDEWDCEKDKNRIIWNGASSPPASRNKDRPIAVNLLPEGQSAYGCYHMLGNVMEWTSSYPRRYSGCAEEKDKKWEFWGEGRYRVLRGGAWGWGHADGPRELSLRNTTRTLMSPDGPILQRNNYESLGFRCAKYPTPARDAMAHKVHHIRDVERLFPEGFSVDTANGFGSELRGYAKAGAEGDGFVFVKKETKFIGIVPVERLRFSNANDIISQSDKTVGNPALKRVLFGYLQWNGDLEVKGWAVEAPKVEKPADGEEEKPGEKPAEKPGEKPAEKPAEAAPTIMERPVMLRADDRGYLFGLYGGRLSLFRIELAGVRHYAYLTSAEQGRDPNVVRKGKAKETSRQAILNKEKSRLELWLPIKPRSKTSGDVFLVVVNLNLGGSLSGDWDDTEPGE